MKGSGNSVKKNFLDTHLPLIETIELHKTIPK